MSAIDEYLSSLTPAQKIRFERIRAIVLEVAPEAEETFSYGMPTFKYNKRPLLYFGAFKNHMSIFPASSAAVKSMEDKLSQFHTSKGTLQFTEDKPIPDPVIKEIIRKRLAEISKN